MTISLRRLLPALTATTFAVMAATGCSIAPFESKSDPSRFYVLESSATSVGVTGEAWPFALAVARVRMPDYLDRPQVVTRADEGRVTFSEFHRWPEPLDKGASRVLADALSARLRASRVAREPALDVYRDAVLIQLDALRFDGELGGDITLRARWRASSVATGDTLASGERTVVVKAGRSSYDAYAAAMASALDTFAAEIAPTLRAAITRSPAGLPVSTTAK